MSDSIKDPWALAELQNWSALTELLDANPDFVNQIHETDPDQLALLHIASEKGSNDVFVKSLIAKGAAVDTKDKVMCSHSSRSQTSNSEHILSIVCCNKRFVLMFVCRTAAPPCTTPACMGELPPRAYY